MASTAAITLSCGVQPTVAFGEKINGGVVTWQPFRDGRQVYNPHAVIVGGSGSGKTETLKVFLWELQRAGLACLVFDFKDDYVQPAFVQRLNAEVHFAEDGLPVDPMLVGVDPLTGRSNVVSHVFTLEGILTKVYDLGNQQAAALRAALFALYERAGYPRTPTVLSTSLRPPAFRDIRTELERAEAATLLGRLSPIFDLNLFHSEGEMLSGLFSGTHVVRFTRLPNEEVKKACAEILLLGCYNEILRLGHYLGLRLALVVDEAHRIANLAAMSLLLREARAYGVAVLLSSQQARDFSDDIYANADTLVALKLNEIRDAERLGALLVGTAQARDMAQTIRQLQTGEALLKNITYHPYVRLRIRPLEQRES